MTLWVLRFWLVLFCCLHFLQMLFTRDSLALDAQSSRFIVLPFKNFLLALVLYISAFLSASWLPALSSFAAQGYRAIFFSPLLSLLLP